VDVSGADEPAGLAAMHDPAGLDSVSQVLVAPAFRELRLPGGSTGNASRRIDGPRSDVQNGDDWVWADSGLSSPGTDVLKPQLAWLDARGSGNVSDLEETLSQIVDDLAESHSLNSAPERVFGGLS
jgi:hypothetical protein